MSLLLRLVALPPQLHILVQCRLASAASSASSTADEAERRFAFPAHPRPTPYQIFHLPSTASQKEIKTRYYDLVRVHHPDSFHSRTLSPQERHLRFQAVTAAYDILRGKTKFNTGWRERNPDSDGFDPFEAELSRRRNAYYAHPSRQPRYGEQSEEQQRAKDAWTSEPEYAWKDRMIMLFGVLSLVAGIVPGIFGFPAQFDRSHKAAGANLKQARSDAQEFGDARMAQVRRRVQEIKSQTS
ncbi:hypothetical protein M378DRAFT_187775 [Amanita muscaria Koide BX008]|uniref:J domain-containing protein n=1 Tax=Amanita muscaria (strain Koide BX008) TaxID=946122 RepID=A0A0C2WVV3_AMAMK|nr:hypothetical protein M378DRAFT_187775 [Amanita muscaria Koide BX008]